jgi:4-amino-4-deoxy-L-arabinose transferase-like glycosyltransferase
MDAILPATRRAALCGSLLAAAAVAALLLATAPAVPMVWDEGDAIGRAERIPAEWPYTVEREGHPALYGIVMAAGRRLSGGWLPPLQAARLGPMLLFSLAAGAMFHRLARGWSPAAAAGGVAAVVLLPRMFAHAHFASIDGPLVSCWVLAWAAFPGSAGTSDRVKAVTTSGATSPIRVLVFGAALGMTLGAKATGWIAPLPFLLWAVLYRDRVALRTLAVGLPLAVLVFWLLNPPLWHQPLGGTLAFFDLNVNRAANPGLNISTQFLGRMYNLDHPLPWYNTLVWTAVTVPVGLLGLATVGAVSSLRRWRVEPAAMLLVLHWAALLVVRAIPGTPPHDGVRLFLPSFAFLAALCGIGAHRLLAWSRARWPGQARRRAAVAAGVISCYLGAASSIVWYAPQWLSYYNLLIGGLPGATALGMEPTYYWDGLDREALDWLHANTAEYEKIAFGACSPENLRLMRRWGILRRQTSAAAPGAFRWYVLQRRPSGYRPEDLRLIAKAEPAFVKRIRPRGVGPWRLDVPIVEVYEYADYRRAQRWDGG